MTLLAACGQVPASAPPAAPAPTTPPAAAPTSAPAAAAAKPTTAPAATTAAAGAATTAPAAAAPTAASQTAPAASTGATLVVWKFGGSNEELTYFPKWNDEFTKRTGIALDYSNNDWATKREKILAAFQAKSLPDILLMDGQSIPDLATLGVLAAYDDLDKSLMAKWQPTFVPEIWNSTIHNGKFYGPSPYVDMGTFLAYNKQMFADAGITKAPETWDDVRGAAQKLTKADVAGITLGWTLQTNDANTVEGIAYANGGRWLDDSGKKVMIGDAGFVDTLQLFVDIVKDGSVPQGITETNFGDAGTLFFQSKAAMWPSLSYVKAIQTGRAPDDFPVGMTLFPHRTTPSGFAKPAATIITPTAAVLITTQSKQKDAALKYADFWSQPEVQAGWDGTEIHGRVPALKANWETATFQRLNPDWYQLYKGGKMFDGSLPMPSFAGLSEAEKALSNAMQQAVLGQASSKDALAEATKKAQAVIDDISA
jgi:ABC-type glycerol-3-phosphate transport system substrate-binding protein